MNNKTKFDRFHNSNEFIDLLQVEEAQAALARKHMQQQELQDRAEKAESEKLAAEKKLFESTIRINKLKDELGKEKESRRKVSESY